MLTRTNRGADGDFIWGVYIIDRVHKRQIGKRSQWLSLGQVGDVVTMIFWDIKIFSVEPLTLETVGPGKEVLIVHS